MRGFLILQTLDLVTLIGILDLKHINVFYLPLGPYPKTDGVLRIFHCSENRLISLSIN